MDIHGKMEVIRQIHKEQEENERALYYRVSDWNHQPQREGQGAWFSFFRIRFMLAVLLFLCLFVMEKKKIDIGGLTYMKISEYIENDMDFDEFYRLVKEE